MTKGTRINVINGFAVNKYNVIRFVRLLFEFSAAENSCFIWLHFVSIVTLLINIITVFSCDDFIMMIYFIRAMIFFELLFLYKIYLLFQNVILIEETFVDVPSAWQPSFFLSEFYKNLSFNIDNIWY